MDLLRRIEKVCHEELNNFRRKMDCKNEGVTGKCNTVHGEWFAVDKAVAIRTVKRWRAFLDHSPYGDDGVLDEFWKARLGDGKYWRFEASEGEEDHEFLNKKLDAWLEKSSREKRERERSTIS